MLELRLGGQFAIGFALVFSSPNCSGAGMLWWFRRWVVPSSVRPISTLSCSTTLRSSLVFWFSYPIDFSNNIHLTLVRFFKFLYFKMFKLQFYPINKFLLQHCKNSKCIISSFIGLSNHFPDRFPTSSGLSTFVTLPSNRPSGIYWEVLGQFRLGKGFFRYSDLC